MTFERLREKKFPNGVDEFLLDQTKSGGDPSLRLPIVNRPSDKAEEMCLILDFNKWPDDHVTAAILEDLPSSKNHVPVRRLHTLPGKEKWILIIVTSMKFDHAAFINRTIFVPSFTDCALFSCYKNRRMTVISCFTYSMDWLREALGQHVPGPS